MKATDSNPNDRMYWYGRGEDLEREFVGLCGKNGIDAEINPEKATNKYAPDIIVSGRVSDLKCQHDPFFMAGKRYGCDPQKSVTFNRKDYERYMKLYPALAIYFWVKFSKQERFGIPIEEMNGIWRIGFPYLCMIIEDGCPEHTYETRGLPGDKNAKSSFILNLNKMFRIL
jgi:hypothetical protein|tara:strand:+ start:107 stop:619 length:513 start_codon:yes stop_codon:yes gene_type:complete